MSPLVSPSHSNSPSPSSPFLAASFRSHVSSLNTMLSGFFTSWRLCLVQKLWLKTNMNVRVGVKEQPSLRTCRVKTFWSGPPNFVFGGGEERRVKYCV